MTRARVARGGRGFSLPELMVVLAVGSTIAALSYPEMTKMLRKARAVEAADRMESILRLAREKALSRRTSYRITLNPSASTYSVDFVDPSGDWAADFDSPIQMPAGIGFKADLGGGAGGPDLLLEPRGTVSFNDAPAKILVYNERGDSIQIEMVRTGRVRSWQR